MAAIVLPFLLPALGGHIPHVLFTAGTFAIMLGIGAQFWQHLLPLCNTPPPPSLAALANVGLLGGWCSVAICLQNTPSYPIIIAGAAAMLLCRASHASHKHCLHLPSALVCAATALTCGALWWQGYAIIILAMSLTLPLSMLLLFPHPHATTGQLWLCFTTAALLLHSLYFHAIITSYPPLNRVTGNPPPSLLFPAIAIGGTLALLLHPPMRHCRHGQRFAGILLTLACALLHGNLVSTQGNMPAWNKRQPPIPTLHACPAPTDNPTGKI